MPSLDSPLVKLAVLAGLVYAATRYGSAEMKIAALGVAGFVVANQLPVVRDALTARLAV